MAALHALDPQRIREQLSRDGGVPTTVAGLLDALRYAAAGYGRAERSGHPWLITGPALAARLNAVTGASARAR